MTAVRPLSLDAFLGAARRIRMSAPPRTSHLLNHRTPKTMSIKVGSSRLVHGARCGPRTACEPRTELASDGRGGQEGDEQGRKEMNGHVEPVPVIQVAHAEEVLLDPFEDIDRSTDGFLRYLR
jgi:hypothetical protein